MPWGWTCGGTCTRHGRAVRRHHRAGRRRGRRGRALPVGLDLKAMGSMLIAGGGGDPGGGAPASMAARARRGRAEVLRLQDAIAAVARCPTPVIAAVHGFCIGGGVDLIAACDIRFASWTPCFRSARRRSRSSRTSGASSGSRPLSDRTSRRIGVHGQGRQRGAGKEIGLVNDVAAASTACARPRRSSPLRSPPLAAGRPGHQGCAGGGRGSDRGRGLDYVASWNAGAACDDLTEAMTASSRSAPPNPPVARPGIDCRASESHRGDPLLRV